MQIIDVGLSATADNIHEAYESALEINGFSSMDYKLNIQALSTTSSTIKYTIVSVCVPNEALTEAGILADDLGNGEYAFKKMRLQGIQHQFYKEGNSNTNLILCDMMRKLASNVGGTFICSLGNNAIVIKDGEYLRANIGIIDSDGHVYCNDSDTKTAFTASTMQINKPLGEFIKENPNIGEEIKKANCSSVSDAMNIVGKNVVNMRLSDSITSDVFADIFLQAGAIGFTDKTCSMIYKLLT